MKTPAGLQFHIHRQSTSIYTETHTMHTCTTYTAHTHTHIYTTNSNIHSSHTRATHTHTAHAYTPHSICTYTYITHTVPAHGCIRTYMHTHTLTIWKSRDFIFKIVKETPDVFSVCFCSRLNLSEDNYDLLSITQESSGKGHISLEWNPGNK